LVGYAGEESDSEVMYWTHGSLPVTSEMALHDPKVDNTIIEAYRVLDRSGKLIEGAVAPDLSETEAVGMYETMVKVQAMDDVFMNAQRQGRISFYMQHAGEEGLAVGSASALTEDDVIFAQYREGGVLLHRGFTLQECADQCIGNQDDKGGGKQMPIHYGCRRLNFQTISSPLATQLPQAVGAAMALRNEGKEAISMVYFGEGAASEGDFHAACNFAGTLKVPVVFFCRNNGYAISTPSTSQYAGDGIVSRAAGYGMLSIRVDGNDTLAVRNATELARKTAIETNRPVFIEAMTYRMGHHSTSDDSTRYRSLSEITHWKENFDPVERFKNYMANQGWWDEEKDVALRDQTRLDVIESLEMAESKPFGGVESLFNDVFDGMPEHLQKQEEELRLHMDKYPEQYEISHWTHQHTHTYINRT
jgi:2-oxoisovalerate dehydrogenase E1 component alpha subunit